MGLRKILKGRNVYFDTNIFIYILEGSEEYASQIESIHMAIKSREFSIVTSEIIFTEILPLHVKQDAQEKIKLSIDFLSEVGAFKLVAADRDICIQAGFLRGKIGMKTPDALHVATAMQEGCDVFLTNDSKIKTPVGIDLVLISELSD
ncbi:MAG: type II toxin-antitoxin system VapC family toxin [Devosiaceae bacterium]|nr:type II toxin-antitoxin system VapC family toxin [Devosiaceae bacterium]